MGLLLLVLSETCEERFVAPARRRVAHNSAPAARGATQRAQQAEGCCSRCIGITVIKRISKEGRKRWALFPALPLSHCTTLGWYKCGATRVTLSFLAMIPTAKR